MAKSLVGMTLEEAKVEYSYAFMLADVMYYAYNYPDNHKSVDLRDAITWFLVNHIDVTKPLDFKVTTSLDDSYIYMPCRHSNFDYIALYQLSDAFITVYKDYYDEPLIKHIAKLIDTKKFTFEYFKEQLESYSEKTCTTGNYLKYRQIREDMYKYIENFPESPKVIIERLDAYDNVLLQRTHDFYNGAWYDENEKYGDCCAFYRNLLTRVLDSDIKTWYTSSRFKADLELKHGTEAIYDHCKAYFCYVLKDASRLDLLKIKEIVDRQMT